METEQNYNINSTGPSGSLERKAILALVFGILSVALRHILGLAFGIVAVVEAGKYMKLLGSRELSPDKRAVIGRILGIVGIVLSCLSIIWTFIKIAGFITALIASISSGSLGIFEEHFQDLGESLRGGAVFPFHFPLY